MSKKSLKTILMITAALLITAIAIIIVAVCGKLGLESFTQVLMYICAFLLFCMAATFGYLLYLSREREPNFFLYDTKNKTNISVDELDFRSINEKLELFLATNFPTENRLWTGDYLEKDDTFGEGCVYKPLIVYKMLYDIAVINTSEGWDLFGEAPDSVIGEMCDVLSSNGDDRMAKRISQLHENYRGDFYTLRDYLTGNIKYMEGRMLGYVKKNVEGFYDE